MSDVTLITAFYDIGRSEWNSQFTRKSHEYVESFRLFLNYDHEMIIYIDTKHYDALSRMVECSPYPKNKRLVSIDEAWMKENIWAWSRLEKEREIMSSDSYRNLIPQRITAGYPENVNPEYTIITHSKIDFVCKAIDDGMVDTDTVMWVDFGYFHNKTQDKHVPKKNIDLSKLNLEKINLCGMNQITEQDKDVLYTLIYAPVKICAYLFVATKENMKWFQSRCHEVLEVYQANGLADDEQGLWLLCYFADAERYKVHYFPEWHMGLKYFTKD
jgi:protein YibB